ncbi:MAG: arylsulfatase [Candidatus Epulonipiscioides saccharophilum]|nr:MAG: arylsulfatase [Epulopiscium sp. AS2M-Bin001]
MTKKPNIVYILADDMGYGDVLKYNENCKINTVNLDKMCDAGLRFTDAHTTSAVCTPSRYGILTGRYNWRSKLKSEVLGGYSEPLIEEETKTIGQLLQDEGYQTACIGKWHLGMSFAKTDDFVEKPGFKTCNGVDYSAIIEGGPNTRGFDYFYGIAASLDMPPYIYIEDNRFTDQEPFEVTAGIPGRKGAWWRSGPTGKNFVHENVLDDLCDKVLEKIEEYKENPFFIYFPLTAPHGPILPSQEFIGKSNTNFYGDFVLHCDDVVGRVMQKLTELNIADDTILVFTTDNGCSPIADFEELHALGHYPSYVFRGHKADVYEGGHRVPYIIKWPNGIKAGSVTDKTVCLSDFFATVADLLDYQITPSMCVDSFSNLPLWNNEDVNIRESVIHQSCDGSLALRKGDFKLIMCSTGGGWGKVKALEMYEGMPDFQLYNLKDDISERKNLVNEHPEIFDAMKKELIKLVLNGRSTPGEPQHNHGEPIWETAKFLEEGVY